MEFHPGELFPRVGFVVTNEELPSRAVVRFHNMRGTAEVAVATIKEGRQAVKMTRLSCHPASRDRTSCPPRRMAERDCLQLGESRSSGPRLVLPRRIGSWTLTSLHQHRVKTRGRLIKHAPYYWLLLAAGHLTRRLFGAMVRRIEALTLPAG